MYRFALPPSAAFLHCCFCHHRPHSRLRLRFGFCNNTTPTFNGILSTVFCLESYAPTTSANVRPPSEVVSPLIGPLLRSVISRSSVVILMILILWSGRHSFSPLIVKSTGLFAGNSSVLAGMTFTRTQDFRIKQLIVASDLQQLIKVINKKIFTKELHRILHDILVLSLVFEKNSVVFVFAKQALVELNEN
ncbi:unnamed protein product [Microthlaspi erraticum]|uniref:RNase H type-1 domain-containing protein n=1 Tax=Microthlaspi erraticum TaxID=1685480 RepID=A0A6D2LF36_9BRAS|nr:unnamed protein product [Microthlaspi erraticum]